MERIYRRHEAEKRRLYEERIREVENGSFSPLIFASTGGAGPSTTVVLKRLGTILAEKRNSSYSETIGWLRCRLAFALLRAAILCVRGSRSKASYDVVGDLNPTVALAEARVNWRS